MSYVVTTINKKWISIAIFIFVNFVFAVRYLSRVTDFYLPIALVVSSIYLITVLKHKHFLKFQTYLRKINLLLLSIFLIAALWLFTLFDVNDLDVDRWSVISSFWNEFFEGRYPYFAKSNVGNEPGPMPFYFLLALPAYLLGELGYFSILGVLLFVLLLNLEKLPLYLRTLAIVLVLGSVFHMWEVICRSNIFLNGTLVLFAIQQILKTSHFSNGRLLYLGLLTGLVLSTRNVFVITFIITFVYLLRSGQISFGRIVILGMYSSLFFSLTFVPFVITYLPEFWVMNPFIVQSSFLVPFHYTLFFIALSFAAGFLTKSSDDVFFYSGVVLFVSIVIYVMYHIFTWGFQKAFFNASADISYLILGLPFLLYYYLSTERKQLKAS